MTAADVNGDGKPDLIVANTPTQHGLGAAQHHRAGGRHAQLRRPTDFATGLPVSVTAADVNGDGKPDLIVARYAQRHGLGAAQHHRAGRHHAQLRHPADFTTGNWPLSVAAADVNGDGKPDLIVANTSASTVSVLLNTTAPGAATPSFATQKTFATGTARTR